ncbi:MAG: hypothetical protein E7314_06285 [Clostridiales bacterium]|nr:hypothetical protein [Clostridiales bacterium]
MDGFFQNDAMVYDYETLIKKYNLNPVFSSASGKPTGSMRETSNVWYDYEIKENPNGTFNLINSTTGKKILKNYHTLYFWFNILHTRKRKGQIHSTYLIRDDKLLEVSADSTNFVRIERFDLNHAGYFVIEGKVYDVVKATDFCYTSADVYLIKKDGKFGLASEFKLKNKDCILTEDPTAEYHIISTDSPAPYFDIPTIVLEPIYDEIEMNHDFGPVTIKNGERKEWVIIAGQAAIPKVYWDQKRCYQPGELGCYINEKGDIVLI